MPEIRPRQLACLSLILAVASTAEAAPEDATWLGGSASAERTYAVSTGPGA